MKLSDLAESARAQVAAGLPAGTLDDADRAAAPSWPPSRCCRCARWPAPRRRRPPHRPARTARATPAPATERPEHSSVAQPNLRQARHRPHPRCRPSPTVTALSAAATPAGHRLPDGGMTTQPQAPVTVAPSLPNRRNAELLLLCFATVITRRRSPSCRPTRSVASAGICQLHGGLPGAVRRARTWPSDAIAPYADPLLLPVVALLNGLGLVMIHRLDLDERAGRRGSGPQRQPADAVDAGRRRRASAARGDLR